VRPPSFSSSYNTTRQNGPFSWEVSWEFLFGLRARPHCRLLKNWPDGCALPQRRSHSRRRGAFSHVEALATGERLHLELSTSQILASGLSVDRAQLLDRGFCKFDAPPKVVCVEYLLHCCHGVSGDRSDLGH